MNHITEQYLDVSEQRSVLEVVAGPDLVAYTGKPHAASLVLFPKKDGAARAEMSEVPSVDYVFMEPFEAENPTLNARGHVNVHLNREQAVELACTLLNAAGVEYELYGNLEDPSDDVFRSY